MIKITITCDECEKELKEKEGLHVDEIKYGNRTNFNFCCSSCLVKYYSYKIGETNAITQLVRGEKAETNDETIKIIE